MTDQASTEPTVLLDDDNAQNLKVLYETLKDRGYQSGYIGKWHLGTTPTGFNHWEIFPGQGSYYNPVFIQMDGSRKREEGYATDLTTEKSIEWLDSRDSEKPFFLMCQHKAPHRTFSPALRHLDSFDNVTIPCSNFTPIFCDFKCRQQISNLIRRFR